MFNIKKNRLPPGSLIRLRQDVRHCCFPFFTARDPIPEGSCVLVIEHSKPVYLKVLAAEQIEYFDFRDLVPLHGYIPYFELLKLPEGKRLEEWY